MFIEFLVEVAKKNKLQSILDTMKNWITSIYRMSSHHEKVSPGQKLPGPVGFSR